MSDPIYRILRREDEFDAATDMDPALSEKCSVLIVVTGNQRRGAEVFGDQLARSLSSTGWDCEILALEESGGATKIDAPTLTRTDEGISLTGLSFRVLRRLRARIRQSSPDVVFAGGGATLKYVALALLGMRSKPNLVYSSIGEPEFWARTRLKRLMLTGLLRRADLVTAVSGATAKQLRASFRVSDAKIRVTPTGVPERFLDVERHEPADLFHVLFIGSLSVEKNPLAALEVFRGMSHRGQMRFVGAGPLEATIRSGAVENVTVLGSVPDVAPHLEWADVLILTSLTEGLPGVVLEASAAAVPVIAFNVGGLSEVVVDEVTGILVGKGDIRALTGALDRVAADPLLLASMSRAARERMRSGYTMSHAVERYAAVLKEGCRQG